MLLIVVPSFNQGRYLECCLKSILSQKKPNIKVVVMDGGSTDDSVDIIKRYERDIDYWQSKEDGGQGAALKWAFERFPAEVCGWINSDDIMLPGAAETVLMTLSPQRRLGLLCGGCIEIDSGGQLFPKLLAQSPGWTFTQEDLLSGGMDRIFQPAIWWRSEIYERVGGIDEKYKFAMDYDLFIRMAACTGIMKEEKFIAAFRRHSESKTSRIKDVHDVEVAIVRARYTRKKQTLRGKVRSVSRKLHKLRWFFLRGRALAVLAEQHNIANTFRRTEGR